MTGGERGVVAPPNASRGGGVRVGVRAPDLSQSDPFLGLCGGFWYDGFIGGRLAVPLEILGLMSLLPWSPAATATEVPDSSLNECSSNDKLPQSTIALGVGLSLSSNSYVTNFSGFLVSDPDEDVLETDALDTVCGE